MSAMRQLKPDHRLPGAPAPAPPLRHKRDQLKTTAGFCVTISGIQLRYPRATLVRDLHSDAASPSLDDDCDRPPGGT